MLKQVTKKQIINRIKFENPWWITAHIEEDYAEMPRRAYFDIFKPLANDLEVRRALVLMGPRRVGKTVMLHHMVQELLDNQINPKKIIFITIENPIYNHMGLEELFLLAKEASGQQDKGGSIISPLPTTAGPQSVPAGCSPSGCSKHS